MQLLVTFWSEHFRIAVIISCQHSILAKPFFTAKSSVYFQERGQNA
ncbi:hypothetical protein B4168_1675 [Anoxybacillus flavithermus]|nr:hypothetical protein B4168_1675 [Anoxybacillus flavithermus]OAO84330.1 hypothetical protein GT23_3865 [Parageobacillus thermoglucosidasius]